jgi:hypothetical protein
LHCADIDKGALPVGKERPQTSQPDTSAEVEDELRVALRARQELGEDLEDEIIESFLSRVQDAIDERVEAKVNEALRDRPARTHFTVPTVPRLGIVLGLMAVVLWSSISLAEVAGALVTLVAVIGGTALAAAILILPERETRSERGSKPGERP